MAPSVQSSSILALSLVVILMFSAYTDRVQGRMLRGCPCGETYEVKKGETLQTISEKCNDPFILEANPHIHDVDDITEGQVLRMQCSQRKIGLCDVVGALPMHLCR